MNPIDQHIGARLASRRLELGTEPEDLAQAIGVPVSQLRRYETGEERISAECLLALCRVLRWPASAFYEGLDITGLKHQEMH